MDPFRKELQRYEMLADQKASGTLKTKIKRQVRQKIKKKSRQEVEDPEFDRRPTKRER